MGGCFSLWISNSDNDDMLSASSANVITINGQLLQLTVPITVSEVLVQFESSSSFICNSDSLYYDETIPALNSDCELQSGQIYFILPNSKLQYPLSASDMAALAVKASSALSSNNNSRQSNNRKARISPVVAMEVNERVPEMRKSSYSDMQMTGRGISRSISVRKLQRYSSRRPKLAVRSFRLRLSTIYESSDHQFY